MNDRITDRIEIVNADCYTLLDGWPSDAALVTDPPYGIALDTRNGTRGNKPPHSSRVVAARDWKPVHGDDRPFDPTPFLRFKTVCLWGANCFCERLPGGMRWLVWDKREGVMQNDNSDCELAWTNQRGLLRIHRQLWAGLLQRGEENGKARIHPTQKPVALLSWCLETCGIRDGLVIDPFMGSGSLGVACHRAGLRYLGVEIDPEHYATARERLTRETAQGLLMPNAGGHDASEAR